MCVAHASPSVLISPSPLKALRERGIKGERVPPWRRAGVMVLRMRWNAPKKGTEQMNSRTRWIERRQPWNCRTTPNSPTTTRSRRHSSLNRGLNLTRTSTHPMTPGPSTLSTATRDVKSPPNASPAPCPGAATTTPRGQRREAKEKRNRDLLAVRRDEALGVQALAKRFGLSRSMVHRILKEAKSHYSVTPRSCQRTRTQSKTPLNIIPRPRKIEDAS